MYTRLLFIYLGRWVKWNKCPAQPIATKKEKQKQKQKRNSRKEAASVLENLLLGLSKSVMTNHLMFRYGHYRHIDGSMRTGFACFCF